MTAEELRIAVAKLGLNYAELGRRLGVATGTPSRWGRGLAPVPKMAQLLITQMLEEHGREVDACGRKDKHEICTNQ